MVAQSGMAGPGLEASPIRQHSSQKSNTLNMEADRLRRYRAALGTAVTVLPARRGSMAAPRPPLHRWPPGGQGCDICVLRACSGRRQASADSFGLSDWRPRACRGRGLEPARLRQVRPASQGRSGPRLILEARVPDTTALAGSAGLGLEASPTLEAANHSSTPISASHRCLAETVTRPMARACHLSPKRQSKADGLGPQPQPEPTASKPP